MIERSIWRTTALFLAVVTGAAVMALPFYYMVVTSLKPLEEVADIHISLGIRHPTLDPYMRLMNGLPYMRFVWNSTWVAGWTVAGNLFFCTLAGYAFAKHRFPGRNAIFMSMLATMMIPGSVLLVPGFLLLRDLGWLDSHLSLIVPGLAGTFGVFLARQFMQGIPNDLLDAGKIDGCGQFRLYRTIVLPLSKPLIATLAILTFLASWNNFISPLIFLFDEARYTLPLGLALLQGRFSQMENVQMAGATLAVLPVLVIFFIFQRQIVESFSTSGLKQ